MWLQLHLYIGLVAGAVFVVMGITGSILALQAEIDERLNEDLMIVSSPPDGRQRYRPLDEIIAAAQAVAQPDGKALFIHVPKTSIATLDVIFSEPNIHGHENLQQVFVDPYNASVTGKRLISDMENHFSEPFVMLVMHLHYSLLLGDWGETGVGVCALFLFGSVASGIYLWWPRNGRWLQAFALKRNASVERLVLDLHKTTGIYVCSILLVILSTGTCLVFGAQTRAIIGLFSPVSAHLTPKDLRSQPSDGRAPIGFSAAADIVDRLLPDGRLTSIQPPDGPNGFYLVGKHSDADVYASETKRLVAVDQYSGDVLHVQDPRGFTAGERFLEWQFPLHTGEAFGDVGRALVLVMGIIPAALYVTGVTRLLQKRRMRKIP